MVLLIPSIYLLKFTLKKPDLVDETGGVLVVFSIALFVFTIVITITSIIINTETIAQILINPEWYTIEKVVELLK